MGADKDHVSEHSACVGEKAVFRREDDPDWRTGVVTAIGIKNEHGYPFNVEITPDDGSPVFVDHAGSAHLRSYDRKAPRNWIFPAEAELASCGGSAKLLDFVKKNNLMVVRLSGVGEAAVYGFVDPTTMCEAWLRVRSTDGSDFRFHDGDFSNGKMHGDDTEVDLVVERPNPKGDGSVKESVETPDDFEVNY